VGSFIVVFLLWRWRCLCKIVTDNGPAMLAALKWLEKTYKYDIKHIRISGYNSRSNGSVEVTHRPICEALIKTGGGSLRGWHKRDSFVFWAERITTRKSIGMSSFYAVHGVEPLLPLDLTHATHFIPDITEKLTDGELLGMHVQQLEQREEDLATVDEQVVKNRETSVEEYIKKNKNKMVDYNFQPGEFVLALNKMKPAKDEGWKGCASFMGPWLVVYHLCSRVYRLAELNGAISHLKFTAFRLILYYPQSRKVVPVTQIVDSGDLKKIGDDSDEDGDTEEF